MIQSMTGYGRAAGRVGEIEFDVELRSINNRHLDVSIRMPRLYLFAEDAMKRQVANTLARGKVDIFVNVTNPGGQPAEVMLNKPLVQAYLSALGELEQFGLKNDVSIMQIARLPDVLQMDQPKTDENAFLTDMSAVLKAALDALIRMRREEGAKLKADILGRLAQAKQFVAQIEAGSPRTVTAYRAKLEERMREVLEQTHIEESRIVTEAAIFADRVAVDEEITRLKSHIAQFESVLEEDGAIGRKLDFLLQELGRETNTVGSKCNDLELGKIVIALKAELEKVREQVQNIE